jgi:hypothetical protein
MENEMIGKSYFERQATMLLRLAKSVKDPDLSNKILTKAADLEEKAHDAVTSPPLVVPALRDIPTE